MKKPEDKHSELAFHTAWATGATCTAFILVLTMLGIALWQAGCRQECAAALLWADAAKEKYGLPIIKQSQLDQGPSAETTVTWLSTWRILMRQCMWQQPPAVGSRLACTPSATHSSSPGSSARWHHHCACSPGR